MNSTTDRLATEKQFAFIRRLLAEREPDADTAAALEEARGLAVEGRLSSRHASRIIDFMLDSPKKPQVEVEVDEPEAGVYQTATQLFRVYLGQKSGRMLVTAVHVVEPLVGEGDDLLVEYTYLGSAARHLPADAARLSLEEVGRLGVKYGSCLVCGRRLDDPESVDRGIGPVCAGKY